MLLILTILVDISSFLYLFFLIFDLMFFDNYYLKINKCKMKKLLHFLRFLFHQKNIYIIYSINPLLYCKNLSLIFDFL